jgi:hypothetical protein
MAEARQPQKKNPAKRGHPLRGFDSRPQEEGQVSRAAVVDQAWQETGRVVGKLSDAGTIEISVIALTRTIRRRRTQAPRPWFL